MLSRQTLALKSTKGLWNSMHLEGDSLILCYSVSFLKTPSIWSRGLSSWGCWFHLQHFIFLLGSLEPSFLHIPRGICKQPKFPPTMLNNFSEGCDYRYLVCLSPWTAAVCSQEFYTVNCLLQYWKAACILFPVQTSSLEASREGVNHCPLFCLCWLESLASHLVQAVCSSSQHSLGKAL